MARLTDERRETRNVYADVIAATNTMLLVA